MADLRIDQGKVYYGQFEVADLVETISGVYKLTPRADTIVIKEEAPYTISLAADRYFILGLPNWFNTADLLGGSRIGP